jgi:hypothetical protein
MSHVWDQIVRLPRSGYDYVDVVTPNPKWITVRSPSKVQGRSTMRNNVEQHHSSIIAYQ